MSYKKYRPEIHNYNHQHIRVIIVDDQKQECLKLTNLLSKFQEIEIVATSSSADQAIKQIIDLKPDLLFLDVQMPQKSGFDLLSELSIYSLHAPHVIFTTVHEEYAINAIKSSAIDYLLKPVQYKELSQSLARYKRITNLLKQNTHTPNIIHKDFNRILLPTIKGIKQINSHQVVYFQKDQTDHITIFYNSTKHEIIAGSYTIKQLIDQLSPNNFFQIDRQTIINLDFLNEIETKSRTCLVQYNQNVIKLNISRGRLKEFKKRLHFDPN